MVLIAGLCVIESLSHTLKIARRLRTLFEKADVPFIFKASFDKANRSSLESYRGPGIVEGLQILEKVAEEVEVPLLTDIHAAEQADSAAEVVDILQIPAFLCRQTDLLRAAGKTGCAVNIKKGQFLAPEDMANAALKVRATGNPNILLTERGVSFGYHRLVVDYRSLPIMRKTCGLPVCFDATHSVQEPGGLGKATGGRREFIAPLARAAAAVGADALFFEVHDNPAKALSDAANALPLTALPPLLDVVKRIDEMVRLAR
jgi:2-dehydro-3-deoxyphosphooctonate aldolase (KDO 8-P synthase)